MQSFHCDNSWLSGLKKLVFMLCSEWITRTVGQEYAPFVPAPETMVLPPIQPMLHQFAGCKFPDSVQGLYRRQDNSEIPQYSSGGTRLPMKYLNVFIGPTSIPQWGDCYDQTGDTYLLGLKKVGGAICYRCFFLLQRTPNVVQVVVKNEDTCYSTLSKAKLFCPRIKTIEAGQGIMLWRSEDVRYEYCPVGGKAYLAYSAGLMNCPFPSKTPSDISNCQLGYQLDIRLRGCSFTDNQQLNLKCLGSWNSHKGNGEKYFAVYNVEAEEYRCGIYKDYSTGSGFATAALSNDSTCLNELRGSTDGFETFQFFKQEQPPWPVLSRGCSFPDWLVGDWDSMTVRPDLITYYHHHDPGTMTTQYAKCVDVQGDQFRIYTRNHCGEPGGFTCLWIQRRSESVIEFKTGSQVLQHDDRYQCSKPKMYAESSWVTLSVRQGGTTVACPHPGHYTTPRELRKPDGFCFNVTVDCSSGYPMHTVGYICGTDSVFDARRYHCIGSWKELSGRTYAVTKKTDDETRGCFVSAWMDDHLHMAWTGKKCDRTVDFRRPADNSGVFVLERVAHSSDMCRDEKKSNVHPGYKEPPSKTPKHDSPDHADRLYRNRYRKSSSNTTPLQLLTLLSLIILQTSTLYFA